jgi:sugar phosphate isomerase/epimerase
MAHERIRIGVVALALSDDPRQAVRASRGMGFEGLQFDGAAGSLDLTTLSGSGRREFRHVLASQDQQLIGLRGEVGARGFGPGADVDYAISRIEKLMETSVGMGSPLVCVDLGPLPAAPIVKPIKPKVDPAMAGLILLPDPAEAKKIAAAEEAPPPVDAGFVSQLNAAMDQVGRHADRYSCLVAFRSELASLASLKQAVTGVRCPWFGIDLDPVAAARDRWDPDEVFSELGQLVQHVRGRDATVGAERRTKPARVGEGSVRWVELLANLDAAGYRGWITIDPGELMDRSAGAEAGAKYLKGLEG